MPAATLRRTHCPLDPAASCCRVVDLPYTAPVFARALSQKPAATPECYIIHYAPALDFYWQEVLLPEATPTAKDCEHAPAYASADLPRWAHAAEEALLFRLVLGRKGTLRAFDFGMGDGTYLKTLAAFGMEPHGYDISPVSRQAAQKQGTAFVPLEDCPDNSFDLIVAREVFEHLPDPLGVAQIVASKLRPGGIFHISTPGDKKICRKLEGLNAGKYDSGGFTRNFDSLCPFEHINLFSAKALQHMAAKAGLRPAGIPLLTFFQATTGFYSWKQFNRAFYNPLKRYFARGTWQLFTKA